MQIKICSGHQVEKNNARHSSVSRLSTLALVLAALLAQIPRIAQAETWAGRALSDILAELRAAGLPLIYSSQIVTDRMRVGVEPKATQDIERLQEALKPFGLTAKSLGANAGYAIVREERVAEDAKAADAAGALDEVTVYASRYSVAHQDQPSALGVPHAILEKTAGTEQDALRALHYFPGAASNSLSALAHIRGGAENETLVQFDGVELYNPVHLKDFQGLFGLIDPEFVQSLEFFSGGYPARFGNHNSGVVDIEPRYTEATNNLLGASVLYTRAMSSGSFDEEQGSWLLGYRRSSVPQVLRSLNRKIGEPEFEDFLSRISYDWKGNKVAVGALRLNDDLRLTTPDGAEQASAFYHDTYVWLSLERNWTDELSNRWLYSHAKLDTRREGAVAFDQISSGALHESRYTRIDSLQAAWTYTPNASTSFDWGLRADHGEASYDYLSASIFLQPLANTFALPAGSARAFAVDPQGSIYSAYASARSGYGAWSGELGLRWDEYSYIDHAARLSPRLSLRYALSAESSLRLSVGRYVQAQTLNRLEASDAMPQFSRPESSEQIILGFDHRFANQISLRIEAYAKHNKNVRPYYENLLDTITLAPELKIDRVFIAPQSFSARGLEVSLRSAPQAPSNWWLTYTWSQARDRVDGKSIPRSWDQPHAISAGFALAQARWQHSAALTWHSGWPYTPLNINISNGSATATLGTRNSQRFNNFASLELRTQYGLPLKNSTLEIFFELRNAFNHANDCCREVSVTQLPNGSFNIAVEQKSWLSLVPLAGIDWRF